MVQTLTDWHPLCFTKAAVKVQELGYVITKLSYHLFLPACVGLQYVCTVGCVIYI